jgi:hypothetical protein
MYHPQRLCNIVWEDELEKRDGYLLQEELVTKFEGIILEFSSRPKENYGKFQRG